MNHYINTEKRLAELLGWQIDVKGRHHNGINITPDGKETVLDPPQWTRDDAAAFRLMVEHGCYPTENGTGSIVIPGPMWSGCVYSTLIGVHPDKATAVRYAIAQAVIIKLENDHEAHQ